MTGPVEVDDGKYTFLIPDGDCRVHILRHGLPWLIIEQGCSAIQSLIQEVERLTSMPPMIPMLLWCPGCGERHIDAGDFATKPHKDHACQVCGMVWRPALVPTCGVQFLPGYKNEAT